MTKKLKRVLEDHTWHRKTLVSPWSRLPTEVIEWEKIYLPEHLWLAYLMLGDDVSDAATIFNRTCDILDSSYLPQNEEVFLGYVSDFARIPPDKCIDAVQQISADPLAGRALGDGFRALVSLYPGGAAEWLSEQAPPGPNRELALKTTRDLVARLRAPRSRQTTQCRMLGLNRLLKHDKIFFSPRVVDGQLARGLGSYPFTDEQTTERVEQFVRLTMNMVFSHRRLTDWSSRFWEANFALFPCL